MAAQLYRFTLNGIDHEVRGRPVDKFTAEDALGFDPSHAIALAASDPAKFSNNASKALTALAWAAYTRTDAPNMAFKDFMAGLMTKWTWKRRGMAPSLLRTRDRATDDRGVGDHHGDRPVSVGG